MIALLLLLSLGSPEPAPDPRDEAAAQVELDACLARLTATSTPAPTLDLQLAGAALRFEACARAGWVRAARLQRAVVDLEAAPVVQAPALDVPAQCACGSRPWLVDLLSHGAAAAIGGAVGAGAGYFVCKSSIPLP